MPQVLDTKVTFTGPADFARQVYGAFLSLGLARGAAQLLVAHTAVSTGWGRGAGNYRLAGVKACTGRAAICQGTESCGVDYTCNWTKERRSGVLVDMYLPFRSYDSLQSGAQGILNVLKHPRYATARQYLMQGDTRYFTEVGEAGWYTASVAATAAKMQDALELVWKYTGGKYTVSPVFTPLRLLVLGFSWYMYYRSRRPARSYRRR